MIILNNLIVRAGLVFLSICSFLASTSAFAHTSHESHTHSSELGLIALAIAVIAYAVYRLVRAQVSLTTDNKIIIKSLMK